MDLTEEYSRQAAWRNWESYITMLPLTVNDKILDLGCSVGTVSQLLSQKVHRVIGIDNNTKHLSVAEHNNSSKNVNFILSDLNDLNDLRLPLCEGIWTSFVPAYFPDFEPLLKSWIKLLKPAGWIAIVEMNDLFAHQPLGNSTQEIFLQYYKRQLSYGIYDFMMGRKIRDIVLKCGLTIVHDENKDDGELTFSGPAEPMIFKAWEARLNRMVLFREYFGEKIFQKVKSEFLECLLSDNHSSKTSIKFIIARKS
jgi:SAM-dependent methyltransferase